MLLRSTLEDAGIDHEEMSCILVKWSSSILNLLPFSDFVNARSSTWYSYMRKLCYFFDLLVLTEEWYVDVLARIRINAFRVELPVGSYEDLHSSAAASVEGEAAVGNAMYMLPAFYNHDCGNISRFLASLVLTFSLINQNIVTCYSPKLHWRTFHFVSLWRI